MIKKIIPLFLSFLFLFGCGEDTITAGMDAYRRLDIQLLRISAIHYTDGIYAVDSSNDLWKISENEEAFYIAENVVGVDAWLEFVLYLTLDGKLYGFTDLNDGYREVVKGGTLEKPALLMDDVAMFTNCRTHVLVLKRDGSVWTFGENGNGQIGNGMPAENVRPKPYETPPLQLEPYQVMKNTAFVGGGSYFSAAISEEGELYTWGDNSFGQIGNGEKGNGLPTSSNKLVTTPLAVLDKTVFVTQIGNTTFAIREDSTLWAWGDGFDVFPQQVSTNVKSVCGDSLEFTFILKNDGTVYALSDLNRILLTSVSEIYSRLVTCDVNGNLWYYPISDTGDEMILPEPIQLSL